MCFLKSAYLRSYSLLLYLGVLTLTASAQDNLKIYFKNSSGDLCLSYKNKEYIVKQYDTDWSDWKYFSLQYWPPLETGEIPEGLLIVVDKDNKVIREFKNTEYYPDFILYDINNDRSMDLVLLWNCGAHSKEVEVWLKKENDFVKVFEKFNDKNVYFSIRNGIPTLAFKKEYPVSVFNHNFPDSDFEFYKWDGKTFKEK